MKEQEQMLEHRQEELKKELQLEAAREVTRMLRQQGSSMISQLSS